MLPHALLWWAWEIGCRNDDSGTRSALAVFTWNIGNSLTWTARQLGWAIAMRLRSGNTSNSRFQLHHSSSARFVWLDQAFDQRKARLGSRRGPVAANFGGQILQPELPNGAPAPASNTGQLSYRIFDRFWSLQNTHFPYDSVYNLFM